MDQAVRHNLLHKRDNARRELAKLREEVRRQERLVAGYDKRLRELR